MKLEKSHSNNLSRRSFLTGAAATTAALGAYAIAGCQNDKSTSLDKDDSQVGSDSHPEPVDLEQGGEWMPASCWHLCGGKCLNKVYMKDNVPVRQKTDDTHEDSYDFPQQRACPRGYAQQQQCFGADRLKYPMKRKNWSPGGGENVNGQLRGEDEWERISWEQAYELMATETKRIYDTYGPRAVMTKAGMATPTYCVNVLSAMGGYTGTVDTNSFGTYYLDTRKLGLPWKGVGGGNDRYDLRNADYIVLLGCNPAWASGGFPSNILWDAKENGAEYVYIGPSFNETASLVDAKWIHILPGTDTAFLIGVMTEMLKLDNENPGSIIDWDFLHKYTVGFDAESMPANAKSNENYKGYLLGEYDGVEKNAEWAAPLCGASADDIKWLAKTMQKDNAVSFLHSFAAARNRHAESVPQAIMTLGTMGGHMGKPGHCTGAIYLTNAGNVGPRLVSSGPSGYKVIPNPVDDRILGTVLWDSILNKKYRYIGGDWHDADVHEYQPAEDRDIDIKMIYHENAAQLQVTPDISKGIEAHKAMDFVVTNATFLNTDALYSDIVLPAQTQWEYKGHFPMAANRETLMATSRVVEPLFEAKDDFTIAYEFAEALGLNADEIFPVSLEQQFMNQALGAVYMDESGEEKTLLTITQEDLDDWGLEGEPQEGIITLEEFLKEGIYQVPRKPDDNFGALAYKEFLDDPKGNPLTSESGKFEIYCQWKADTLADWNFGGEFKPYANYDPSTPQGFIPEDSPNRELYDKYPLIAYNPHYYRRAHTCLDNIPWLREAWTNPVFVNAKDAKERGVETGDTVLVESKHGKILRRASVTNSLMPGTVGIPHGAWIDINEDGIDEGGADNSIAGTGISGSGASGYNNYNVEFSKYDRELPSDVDRPLRAVDIQE